MESLFNNHTVREKSSKIHVSNAARDAVRRWHLIYKNAVEKGMSETDLYDDFRRCILEDLLEYPHGSISSNPSNAIQEENVDFQVAGADNEPLLFVEAKSPGTRLDAKQSRGDKDETPVSQLWRYMTGANPTCKHGMCTNYDDFWLVLLTVGKCRIQKFRFSEIKDDDGIREFIWLFQDLIRGGSASEIHSNSVRHDNDIGEKFYALFHDTRRLMIDTFSDSVPRKTAVSTAQLFLNRLVFIFFAEDLGLVGRDRLCDDIEAILQRATSATTYAYDTIIARFTAYNEGSDGSPKFNGGLFAKEIDRNISFRDMQGGATSPIITGMLTMGRYNFKTELDVNILGRIFEQSIADLDRLHGIDERKSEGIYYTPDAVTEYICRNTIVPYLSKSGSADTPADLLTEYVDDMEELERRLGSIRILDPACGSGAFLVKAAETMLEIHGLMQEERQRRDGMKITMWTNETKIREIILGSIFGVDKSEESVGITMLSMYLKTAQIAEPLPDLTQNIKAGNSLVGYREAVSNALDWETAFPDIMNPERQDDLGFDVIIGNPPYVRQEKITLKRHMALPEPNNLGENGFSIPSKSDLSSYFFYHSINLLRGGGRLGFISSEGWMNTDYGRTLQRFLLKHTLLDTLVRFRTKVFKDADTKAAIILLRSGMHDGGVTRLVQIPSHENMGDMNVTEKSRTDFRVGNWYRLFADRGLKARVPMVRMSEAGTVRRGTVTGWDKYFVLDADTARTHGIEEKYLTPIVSRSVRSGLLSRKTATKYILNVNESKGSLYRAGMKGVLGYIEHGENTEVEPTRGSDRTPRTIPHLSTIKARRIWYSLKLGTPPPVILRRIIGVRPGIYENDGTFHTTNKFVHFTPDKPADAHAFLAYLASSWFALHLEFAGHPMGGGGLSVETIDFKESPVPDFRRMQKPDVERMGVAWLAYREDQDQQKLDGTIHGILGFNADESAKIERDLAEMSTARRESK